ncbi:MAG TPA: DUF6623 family protein [Thermoanaerobaculia bacterium]|jgi:hypothetical protein|nr:DUF6623 family protein [Thermoanaerobaculia bacterium]
MGKNTSWVHGNAVTVESPENLAREGHYGWGADMLIHPGKSSWFHIPLPSPVIVNDARTSLHRVFLMFKSERGSIHSVHVYDGSSKPQELNNLLLQGEHRLALDAENTFMLEKPHTVVWGIGISFYFVAEIGFDNSIPPARLIVAAAGGEFVA